MSGPGKNGDSYRCDACRQKRNRCAPCRAARAEYRRELQNRKRAAGICIECTEAAIEGQTRCEVHEDRNRQRSRAGQRKRRNAA